MDLSQVKAAVKSWEKEFRRSNGRDPTKEDIKRDPGDIAELYALYRRLSKAFSSSQSQSQGHSQISNRTQSQSLQPPSSSSASSSYSHSQHSRSTPRTISSSEYPTTPTPPARRTASSRNLSQNAAGPSTLPPPPLLNNGGPSTPSRSLKRTASKAALQTSPPSVLPALPPLPSPASASRNLFTTPKKVKGYSGPVYDPNPVNPFAISTPTKSSPSTSKPMSSTRATDHSYQNGQGPGPSSFSSSPFIHASSPRKLKQVLEANSLRKVKEREREQMKEVTPRTRARKRLRGEPVEDTPMKDKIPRRRRGDAPIGNGGNGSFLKVPGSAKTALVDHVEDEDEEDEDELGPSPLKDVQGATKSFSTLFAEAETGTASSASSSTIVQRTTVLASNGSVPDEIRRGRPSEMLGLFGQIGKSNKKKRELHQSKREKRNGNDDVALNLSLDTEHVARSRSLSASPTPAPAPVISITATVVDEDVSTADSPTRLPTPPPDIALEAAASHSQSTPSRAKRRDKVVSISDDEEDEWDPEGGRVVRRVVIVPTRRAAQRRNSDSDYDDVDGREQGAAEEEEEDGEEEDGDHPSASPSLAGEGTTLSSTIPSPTSSLAPTYLSMLSLTSPQAPRSRKKAELDALRVKAIFDPVQAARLKAITRGQEVVFSGEAGQSGIGEEDEDGLLAAYDAGLIDEDGERDAGEGGVEGDDDWESESEGWKRTADGLDDEW